MARFVLVRLLQVIPMLIGVTVLVFILIRLAPGDPISLLAGERSDLAFQERLREQLGLDQTIWVQLVLYVGSLLRGDLGYSFTFQQPVMDLILGRLPATLLLMAASFVISAVVGIWVGVWTAARRESKVWKGLGVAALVGYSIPTFWLGVLLVLLFGVFLEWFPIVGMTTIRSDDANAVGRALDIAHHMVLPVVTLTTFYLALITRLTRASMTDSLEQDYVVTAWGKGLPERKVVYRHALRNAMLPVVTVLGLQLGAMVAGFLLVEVVFAWPGLGRLTFDAIQARDYPIITGVFVLVSISVILANLVTDILYAVLDPRIRYA